MDDGSDQVEELTLEPADPPRRSRRVGALWAVLAAGALVAGAVVVSTAGDDDGPAPGLPVALGSPIAAREASGAADAMLAPVTYVAGDDLPALGGEATAYQLAGTVTEDDVRSLADALGLAGEVVRAGESWTVDDGTSHLEVYEGGGAQWWYSADGGPAVSGGSSSGSGGVDSCTETSDDVTSQCEVLTSPSTPTTSVPEECTASDGPAECLTGETTTTIVDCGPGADCVAPTAPPPPSDDPDCPVASDGSEACVDDAVPPPNLPSEADARAIALDLLAATGMAVDDADVSVEGGSDAWYVMVEPRLDGVPSGMVASVAVGDGGAVMMASGTLVEPEALGQYPLLDTRGAIDRANTDGPVAQPGIAVDTGTSTAVADTTVPPCAVQPDGREICEKVATGGTCEHAAEEDAVGDAVPCDLPSSCPQVVPPVDDTLDEPESIDCDVPVPDPGGVPAPAPDDGRLEVVLVDAEPALVILSAVDGSTDGYLVPAYRFTDADGGRVDLAAVADSALTTPPTTGTSAEVPSPPDTGAEPQPCDAPLVEEDASGTTITVQPDIGCVAPDPVPLAEGEEPALGVGYYVDVDTECEALDLGGTVWILDEGDVSGWADPGERHEGGIFTLDSSEHGTFVGDYQGITTATFRLPSETEQISNCDPVPRS